MQLPILCLCMLSVPPAYCEAHFQVLLDHGLLSRPPANDSIIIAYSDADWLVAKILVGQLLTTPTRLYCDNVSATHMTANPVQHDRSKHIAVDYHFVQERVPHGDLIGRYIPTGSHC